MNLNFEVEGPNTWQLVTGNDPSQLSSNAQAAYFAKHSALENLLLGMVR